MSLEPLVSFVIPVRDDAERLGTCLASIARSRGSHPVEIIVVDNGSRDSSAEVARRSGAIVVALPDARVSEARNAGAARATAALLAFVDADHEIDPGWIEAVSAIFRDSAVAAAGAPYATPDRANWVQRAYAGLRPRLTGQERTDWLGSGNLVVRREAFTSVGGFDTRLESCEDVDFCNRLTASGFRLVADSRLRSVHHGDPRTLRALFFGELWRGRDNVRVTLRGPLTAAQLPSVGIPLVGLVCGAMLLASPWLGLGAAAAAAAVFGSLATLRAVRMWRRRDAGSARHLLQDFALALVYDAARAAALVVRATHRTRRETAGERAVA